MNFNKVTQNILVLLLLYVAVWPGPALAVNTLLVEDYQIQLFTDPEPLIAGKETFIIAKILRSQDRAPVRDAKIYFSITDNSQGKEIEALDLKKNTAYQAAREVDEFGNYQLKTTFKNPGGYFIQVAINALKGKKPYPPVTVGFTVTVKAPNSNLRIALVLLSILSITIVGIYLINVRRKITPVGSEGLNLLDIPWVKRLLQSKYFQPFFQVPLLGFTAILLILAFVDIQDSGKNVSTMLIWIIWWAGIIFTFALVGRMWCFMCPVGALSEWTSRFFEPHRLFPPKLRNMWLANFMFIGLTWLDIQIGVVRSPMVTGSLLIGITVVAVVVGFFFQRRTFCRYLCPIGSLIGIYSMFSAVELRSKDCEICRNHKYKDCYVGNKKGYGCPMFEIIPAMDSNNLCSFCGECIKTCPKNNITLRFRPFFKDAWTTGKRSLDEAALAVALVGISIFVTGDMLAPWAGWMESAMKFFPAQQLGITYQYTVEVVTKSALFFGVSLLLIPGIILLAAAISNKIVGQRNHKGIKQTFINFGYMFIPIGLSMHLAHNTGHLLKESGGVVPAVQRVINKYTPFFAGTPDWSLAAKSLINPSVLYWIQMVLFTVFYIFSLYSGYRLAINNYANPNTAFKALMPMIFVSFVLIVINVYLLNLPMAPRHTH
ncbi:MAG: 4Fe-4S binding protein [Candidatus Desulfatibia sp.]|uniref:4Fe-4S binding protein n=1 Tax=Candidatus Desulfatibia sp. TaxID=3101189 RepID=UPI002F2F6681